MSDQTGMLAGEFAIGRSDYRVGEVTAGQGIHTTVTWIDAAMR
jgi:hypothetical protein